ncbi:hypothetical protein BDZ94DRAFT_735885 [Collybia nuda]|uniref:Uncharacterized protein n=1 Tax=Collybia nuda TaxID=64659 RepID=A0A9P5Y4X8_9AGAR|nr:hypothetical protein BDZ94DRAFT_735885 [Collybia nuda]
MSSTFSSYADSKHIPSLTTTMQPLPSYQNPQPTIYVQQQPSIMTNPNPMLQPQGTGTMQQTVYPPQPVPPMMNSAQQYSPPLQPTMQAYPPTMQPNPMMVQNPMMIPNGMTIQNPVMMQPQYIQPLTPALTGDMYRSQLCATGQHQWNTVYGPVGIITAILCFPIGLLALLVDKKNVCARCQTTIPA